MQPQSGTHQQSPMSFLPRSPEGIPHAYASFQKFREHAPVYYDEISRMWHVFRYDDVSRVISDYNYFSSSLMGKVGTFLADTLVAKDPPDHRKLRNLVNLAFTPRAVAHLSDNITQITQELIDAVKDRGTMDVVSDIAFPLPAKVIAELLGVPAEDWDIFRRWASVDTSTPNAAREDQGQALREETTSYFTKLLEQRRRHPRNDLISALSVAEVDGERLSEHELVSFCFLLLAAGQETTKNLIANAILCLTDHPEALDQLTSEPGLINTAVEEVLRYLSPAWFLLRNTRTDVELGGQHIPANQMVMSWLASANRDPAHFTDPDRFDIRRDPNRHLDFGHGIHFCIGSPLARLEARIALPMILQQLGNLQRVKEAPVPIHVGIVFVIGSLPVTFQAV